ncbi:putative DNA-binding transcriptional regulator YafY [Sedimentibacter saalensis]|uniref:Putative DNA-binding transcriptional regulator YafY n=2 Tax=Sedimentibacter saalensis TaxID=130788 RepID=A0A562JCL1_9FIRM|nr:putative DNA-binding transcriptional regulator YafY [Sedimentibacter saalensis]
MKFCFKSTIKYINIVSGGKMSKLSNQKLKLMYLLKILFEKTDSEHSLTVPDLINELKKYDINAERKSIYNDIDSLKSYGIDILCKKSKTYSYYVGDRTFELAELKLLADAVASSKFITERKSRDLIRKISSLASNYEALQLKRQVYVADRVKTMNEKIYCNVDRIHLAVATHRQISFKYFEYTVDKKKRYRNNGERYTASPYTLTWYDENYYLIADCEKHDRISHFRVDKMEDIEILEIAAEQGDHINFGDHAKKVFGMFGGEEVTLEALFDNSLLGVVIDRFGEKTIIHKYDQDNFMAIVRVQISPPFLGWIFQFGNKVKILSPDNVKNKLVEYCKEVEGSYC